MVPDPSRSPVVSLRPVRTIVDELQLTKDLQS